MLSPAVLELKKEKKGRVISGYITESIRMCHIKWAGNICQ